MQAARTIRTPLALLAAALLAGLAAAGARHPDEVAAPDDRPTEAFKPGPAGAPPVRGDTAVLTLLGDIDSLNPYTSSSGDASEVHSLIFPHLMVEEADYYKGPPTFTPNVAESWTFGADGLSIRFRLRECTWSDGTPMTAEDVRFSWQAAKSPQVAWVSASIVDFIRDVEVHGPRDFTVHFTQTSPYLIMDINDVTILPKHTFGQVPFEKWQTHGVWTEQASVSGGPFLLESTTPGEQIALVRNPRYWREGQPYLDRVVFRIIPDMRQQLTAVLAGDTDCMRSVVPKDAGKVLEDPDLDLYTYVTRSYGYVGWNCKRWPFDDARVRNAMTHAIDRENIVEALFRGYAKPAAAHIISSFWASNPDIQPLEFDPDAAERLLAEAGFTKGSDGIQQKDGKPFRFVLTTNSGNTVRQQICELVQADLAQIGVKAEVRLIDFNQMSQQLKLHEFDAYVGGWFVATKVDLKNIWHSSAADGRFNYVSYANPRVDAIIDQARVMSDFDAARPLWYELQEILHADQPYTMLYEPRGLVALHKRFQDVKVNSLRAFHNIQEWWVPADQRRFK